MAADNKLNIETAERLIESWARSNLPIYEFMSLRVNSVSGGVYKCSVPLDANTGNHISTLHAAFQFAAAEILGGLVVLCNRTDETHVPVVKRLSVDFKHPALSGISSEASFSDHEVEVMNRALQATGRYDFELASIVRNEQGQVVAEATGCYAVRTMA